MNVLTVWIISSKALIYESRFNNSIHVFRFLYLVYIKNINLNYSFYYVTFENNKFSKMIVE